MCACVRVCVCVCVCVCVYPHTLQARGHGGGGDTLVSDTVDSPSDDTCPSQVSYRVAKMHRMLGRATSGGAFAPEPPARHKSRTLAPRLVCHATL